MPAVLPTALAVMVGMKCPAVPVPSLNWIRDPASVVSSIVMKGLVRAVPALKRCRTAVGLVRDPMPTLPGVPG